MDTTSFAYQFSVEQSPARVWTAICDVRGWWSQEIEGATDRLGSEFRYHYQDVHRCTFRITELLPQQKMVWHVLANEFNFTKDKAEWVGTNVVFELVAQGTGTLLLFRHEGLVPTYECFEICRDAWSGYLGGSLKNLILTGQGQPNPLENVVQRANLQSTEDFLLEVELSVSPGAVMEAVERPKDWWAFDVEGSVATIGDQFEFRHKDIHYSLHRVTQRIPGRKAVWAVTDSQLSFTKDPHEWTGTELVFEAVPHDGGSRLVFQHRGLNRQKECYADCAEGWTYFIEESLKALILTGVGKPEAKSR